MSVRNQIPDAIRRTARSLGYALWVGDSEQWLGLSLVLRARLTDEQRAALAFAALKSLDYTTACMTADAALCAPLEQGEAA